MVRRRLQKTIVVLITLLLALSACSRSNPEKDKADIAAVLQAEAQGVAEKDIDKVMALWAEDAEIRDAHHTPDDPGDDVVWSGKDAIRERYVKVVFPGNPSTVYHPDMQFSIHGNEAVVTTTTKIGNEVAPSGDRWTLKKVKGRWVLTSLTYNLEK